MTRDIKFEYTFGDFVHQSGFRFTATGFGRLIGPESYSVKLVFFEPTAQGFRELPAVDIDKLFDGYSHVECVTQCINLCSGWSVNITREPTYEENNV